MRYNIYDSFNQDTGCPVYDLFNQETAAKTQVKNVKHSSETHEVKNVQYVMVNKHCLCKDYTRKTHS